MAASLVHFPSLLRLLSVRRRDKYADLTKLSAGFTLEFLSEMSLTLGADQVLVHPSTVIDNVKHHYLEFLRERNLTGLYDFLCTFINSLAVRHTMR